MTNNEKTPSWNNPLWYGKYRIYLDWDKFNATGYRWAYCHDDFDGAPDSDDNRCGVGHTVEECISEIEAMEEKK